jgi:hypothetical protein
MRVLSSVVGIWASVVVNSNVYMCMLYAVGMRLFVASDGVALGWLVLCVFFARAVVCIYIYIYILYI